VTRHEAAHDPAPVAAWALLVYTVPAKPTRKRATVWREVKRLGALYLRDGVCALPDTPAARAALQALAERVQALDGEATLIWEARLSPARASALRAALTSARRAEYAEVASAAVSLLRHLEQEVAHHALERSARIGLCGELGRVERWLAQIEARDYLSDGDPQSVAAVIAAARAALADGAA